MLPSQKTETILDHIPTVLGRAVVDVCLSSFPLTLAAVNLTASLTGKYISLRNEKQVATLLLHLRGKIEQLESEQALIKSRLKENVAYQEVAHKRLSTISALDSERDLKLSASLVALCGALTGEDPKDKHLVKAIGEISADEVRLFLLVHEKQKKFKERKSNFSDLERIDAQSERDLNEEISVEFFNEGGELLGLDSFSYLLGRIHSFGLIEPISAGGFSTYSMTPKVYPPKLTMVGDYFVQQLRLVELTA